MNEMNFTQQPTQQPQPQPHFQAADAAFRSQSCLARMRTYFALFGGISLLMGVLCACCFYKTGMGINYPIFTIVTVVLLELCARKLERIFDENKQPTGGIRSMICYDIAAILFSVGCMLTASVGLQFISFLATFAVLELGLLRRFYMARSWSFWYHIKRFLAMPFECMAQFGKPYADAGKTIGKSRLFRREKAKQILLGVVIAIPVLLLVITLLASADMIFSGYIMEVLKRIFLTEDPILIVLIIVLVYMVCYAVLCTICYAADMRSYKKSVETPQSIEAERQAAEYRAQKTKKGVVTVNTVMLLLTVVYLIFCGIQIVFLFNGGNLDLPKGYTYSEYARQGFFELLVVTGLNFLMVLFCLRYSDQSKSLTVILVIMTVCTYIMIGSAAYRMFLYIDVYHLTVLRVLVLWFLGVNVLLMTSCLLRILKEAFPLFDSLVWCVIAGLLVLVYCRPDALIAEYNIAHDDTMTYREVRYLTRLSEDSIPAVCSLLQEEAWRISNDEDHTRWVTDAQRWLTEALKEAYEEIGDRDFRAYNLSYERARKRVKDVITTGNRQQWSREVIPGISASD